MILNRILSIGFLIAIHSKVAEGVVRSPLANGVDDADAQRQAEVLNGLLRLRMATFLSVSDSAYLASTVPAAQEIIKSHLQLARLSATELLQSYAAAGKTAEDQKRVAVLNEIASNHAPGSKYSSHLLNMECKRRMDVFKSLFRNEEIKSLFGNMQSTIEGGVTHERKTLAELEKDFDDHIREKSKFLANDQTEDSDSKNDAIEMHLKDACVVLSSLPFNKAVDFFLGDVRMYRNITAELFRKMVKILFAVVSGSLHNKGGAALSFASKLRDWDIVKLLLDHGVNVDIPENYGRPALLYAVTMGDAEFVTLLLLSGADVNIQNNNHDTALITASRIGRPEIVKLLLEVGADVNIPNNDHDTALIIASRIGRPEIVKVLLEGGADVDIQNNSHDTALFIASKLRRTEVVKLLLEHGADVNIRNENHDTALLIAAKKGHTEIVKLLLERGADANIRNKIHATALSAAMKEGHTNIVRILRRDRLGI